MGNLASGCGLGLSALLCVLPLSCFAGGADAAYPLYPNASQPLPRPQVAVLMGAIESVDGQRVAQLGHSFALMPGCHEVTNTQHWGGSDNASASMATLPELHYLMAMRAGMTYVLDVAGGGGRVKIVATEQGASGQVTNSFEPGAPCGAVEAPPAD